MSKKRVPRTRANETMTEAQFWSMIRSGLRSISQNSRWQSGVYKPIWEKYKRPYTGENKRQKWEYECYICKEWHMRKHMQMEHVIPCGTLRDWDHIVPFLQRLLIEEEGRLLPVCKPCHKEKTKRERNK